MLKLTDIISHDESYYSLLFLILSQRVNQCLRDACSASTIPYCDTFIDCGVGGGVSSGQYRQQWFNDSGAAACFSTGNGGTFQYGIYGQAVLLTTEVSAVKRYIYSLFWGFQVFSVICFCLSTPLVYVCCIQTILHDSFKFLLLTYQLCKLMTFHSSYIHFNSDQCVFSYLAVWFQQISTLAGNLVPSYFEWEVLFTMAIIGLGLLLFALLIGNMQNFLQALGRRYTTDVLFVILYAGFTFKKSFYMLVYHESCSGTAS